MHNMQYIYILFIMLFIYVLLFTDIDLCFCQLPEQLLLCRITGLADQVRGQRKASLSRGLAPHFLPTHFFFFFLPQSVA